MKITLHRFKSFLCLVVVLDQWVHCPAYLIHLEVAYKVEVKPIATYYYEIPESLFFVRKTDFSHFQ